MRRRGSGPVVALLGPQRRDLTAGAAVRELLPEGPVWTITAGWQEREAEDAELDAELGGRSQNLLLYERAEDVMRRDPDLRRSHRALQDRLKLLRRSYNLRLSHAVQSWIEVEALKGASDVLAAERSAALEGVRRLDEEYLDRVTGLRRAFEQAARPAERPVVQRHRHELLELVSGGGGFVVAGGHVAVLLNRLRLFGASDWMAQRTVIAWSAGAMAVTSTVVIFHDRPPWGPGHAEAFDRGLGLGTGVVALPAAGERLLLDDPDRVGRLARRFGPSVLAALEGGTRLDAVGSRLLPRSGVRVLTGDGTVREMVA